MKFPLKFLWKRISSWTEWYNVYFTPSGGGLTPPSNHTKLGAALTIKNICNMYLMKKKHLFFFGHYWSNVYSARVCKEFTTPLIIQSPQSLQQSNVFLFLNISISIFRLTFCAHLQGNQPFLRHLAQLWHKLFWVVTKSVNIILEKSRIAWCCSNAWCDEKDRLFK